MQQIPTTTQHLRTVTSKGQVTIPVEIREMLGIHPNDQVVIQVSEGRVEIKQALMKLEQTFGAVPALKKPVSIKQMRDIAIEEHLEKFKK